MKKALKNIIITMGIFAAMTALLLGSVLYITRCKVTVVDSAKSADGVYEVVLQAVGEPAWPFGSAPGRLVLKKDEMIISKTDFRIANDGASLGSESWNVTWYDDYVETILSGEEQYDELVTLYYDGQVEQRSLTTHYGIENESDSADFAESAADTESCLAVELFSGEQQITAGYKAIYELYSDSPKDDFEVHYGATEYSSKCILSENENTIEYLVYNGKSKNEKCGLYVHYQSQKNSDGTWSDANGMIMTIYAYVYENGSVVNSGKTHWEDIGSATYQEVTGEKYQKITDEK